METIVPRRFWGVARLFGAETLEAFTHSSVAVVGIGGVGSWAAEALARSGVGQITLVDLDDICETNTNRQIHTVTETIGQPKCEAMANRIKAINPDCICTTIPAFLSGTNAVELLSGEFDCVVDAIDRVSTKASLLATCRDLQLPVVTVGGAGGRRDPAAIKTADLADTWGDELLRLVRKKLRQTHAFPRGARVPFNIPAVYSTEPRLYPWADGRVCATPEPGTAPAGDCETGFGTSCAVTGSFGLFAASLVLDLLATSPRAV